VRHGFCRNDEFSAPKVHIFRSSVPYRERLPTLFNGGFVLFDFLVLDFWHGLRLRRLVWDLVEVGMGMGHEHWHLWDRLGWMDGKSGMCIYGWAGTDGMTDDDE
jgi:hypothetical protein